MTIWACQAGKDVYVEKPCSHNVHEGRIAVEAARKYNRIVQHGTQSRSEPEWASVAECVKSGQLRQAAGLPRPLLQGRRRRPDTAAYRLRSRRRRPTNSISTSGSGRPRAAVPREPRPLRWHWFWDFGNGDIGNQGVHQMDIARWMIPGAHACRRASQPRRAVRLQGPGPDAEHANRHLGLRRPQLIFEVRGLPTKPFWPAKDGDNVLHFEGGIVANAKKKDGKSELQFFAKGQTDGEPLPKVGTMRGPGGDNFGNFIAAVRSRKVEDLNADIAVGELSCNLIHYANTSYRCGTPVPLAAARPRRRSTATPTRPTRSPGSRTISARSTRST